MHTLGVTMGGRGHILFILPNSGNEQFPIANCHLTVKWVYDLCVLYCPAQDPDHAAHSQVYLTRPHSTYSIYADTAVWLWFMHNECANCFVFVALDWKFFLERLLSAKRLRKINAIWIGCERALKLILPFYYLLLEILLKSNELLMHFSWP